MPRNRSARRWLREVGGNGRIGRSRFKSPPPPPSPPDRKELIFLTGVGWWGRGEKARGYKRILRENSFAAHSLDAFECYRFDSLLGFNCASRKRGEVESRITLVIINLPTPSPPSSSSPLPIVYNLFLPRPRRDHRSLFFPFPFLLFFFFSASEFSKSVARDCNGARRFV